MPVLPMLRCFMNCPSMTEMPAAHVNAPLRFIVPAVVNPA
jgi:hypothetical protein